MNVIIHFCFLTLLFFFGNAGMLLCEITSAQAQDQAPQASGATGRQSGSTLSPEAVQQLPANVRRNLQQQASPEMKSKLQDAQAGGLSQSEAQNLADQLSPSQQQQLQQQLEAEGGSEAMAPDEAAQDPFAEQEGSQEQDAGKAAAQVRKSSLSSLEKLYRQGYSSYLSKELKQFGYDIFQRAQARPSMLAVPDDNYIIGPGDQLRIRLWGTSVDTQYTGTVYPDGTINVPKIGIISVSGVKLGNIESLIRKEAQKYVQGIHIDVSLEKLRSVEIYVVGAVNTPGLHLVPAFSTALKALMVAGGVTKQGTLRHIQIYRDGTLYRELDLYDFLLHGTQLTGSELNNNDIIHVPRIGPTAAVAGAVQQEGIYELKKETAVIEDLLDLSGGILPQGFTGRVYLRRYTANNEFVVQDINTATRGPAWKQITINSGDLLELQFLSAARPNVVRLQGHVLMPDVFKYEPGLKLSDILTSPELLKPEAITEFALLRRYDPESTRYTVERFPLEEVFAGTYDQELKPLDQIHIFSRETMDIREYVQISGPVWKPGSYTYRPGMRLTDLLALAGGVKESEVIPQNSFLLRYSQEKLDFTMQRIDLQAIREGRQSLALRPYDRIKIQSRTEFDWKTPVTISGGVWNPGRFDFQPGLTLGGLVDMAGGQKFGANLQKIQISRKNIRADEVQTRQLTLDLQQQAKFELKPYDYVHVPQRKDATVVRTVTLSGEFQYPGTYQINEDETLSEVIQRAGGFTDKAYFYGARFTSPEARKVQQESIDRMIQKLQIQVQRTASSEAQTALSDKEAAATKVEQSAAMRLIEELKKIRAKGTVAIELKPLEHFTGSTYDFEVRDGQALHVPQRPSFVNVVGSVYSPSSFFYSPDLTVGDYLDKSGGPVATANEKFIYVLKANGEVTAKNKQGGLNLKTLFSVNFYDMKLHPGDTIVVPEDLDRVPILRTIKDVTEIVARIATTAGVAVAIAH